MQVQCEVLGREGDAPQHPESCSESGGRGAWTGGPRAQGESGTERGWRTAGRGHARRTRARRWPGRTLPGRQVCLQASAAGSLS